MKDVNKFMRLALEEAKVAFDMGEVPVGAVIVKDDQIIVRAHNLRENSNYTEAHAEMIAIKKANEILGSYRLDGCDIYVTLEPCPMCAGALLQSHINNIYFGVVDHKNGALGGCYNLLDNNTLKFNTRVYAGILEKESYMILKEFFEKRR